MATIRSATQSLTYDDLDGDALELRSRCEPETPVVLRTDDAAVVAAALAALENWSSEVWLVPPGLESPALPSGATTLTGADLAVGAPSDTSGAPVSPTKWVLFTSGTTGEPKPIVHTRTTLSRTVVARPDPTMVWGLLYDPNRMAGLQVLLQALTTRSSLVIPDLHAPLTARLDTLVQGGVTALSATPSLWRQMLQAPQSTELGLRQITLGGEIADQRILDALAARFPDARIVHVFASTETGAAFSVRDGRAGFPVDFLDDAPKGIELDIRDGVLHVFSPGVSTAGPDGFASTGDRVDVVDDRVVFLGRDSGVVNIGGNNVWPEVVETMLREHDDVNDAVVTARPNPLMGNVLVATVELRPGVAADGMPKQLRSWVRDRAPRTHVPATVDIVERLEISSTGKVIR
ncbi:MAG: AMP-binding protein [Ilumatobacter fluminis]|uniref:AMP-binding protein n=1 Tax=Ilumatobacter fluminis TaxID=467091 RepID=UPI0032ED86C6